jgi:exodeoxyribonuclease-3
VRRFAAPHLAFPAQGYELAHHGEGRWNGVAIASRVGIDEVVTHFGEPLRPARTTPRATTSRCPRRA